MTVRLTRTEVALAGVLAAAIVIAYWPAMHGTLLWDDAGHLTRPELRSWHGLWRIWFEIGASQQYYPLLHSAFWIEHRLWGDHVFGYHLVNVLQHTWSALMIGAIVGRLGLPGGWLAAFVFALHPMQVESVAWIAEQKNTLSTALYLTAARVYLDFDQTRSARVYAAATGLFLAAVLSKTTTVTLPAAIGVVLWWRHGTLRARRDLVPLAPWCLLALAGAGVTIWVERAFIGATGSDFGLSVLERAILAGRILVFYVATMAWPDDLMFNYPRWTVDARAAWQYACGAAVLLSFASAWWVRDRTRGPLTVALLFVGTLAPALGFIDVYPFVYSYVADHFAYLSTIMLIVPAAVLVTRLVSRQPARLRRGSVTLVVVMLAVLGSRTSRESAVFRDVDTLYRTTIARNPDSWMPRLNLGVLLTTVPGRLEEAAGLFDQAVRLRPAADVRRNLALAWSQLPGREPEALHQYELLVASRGVRASDHVAFGHLLSRTPGRKSEATTQFRKAVALDPADAEAHYALAGALAETDVTAAEAAYRRAIALEPDFAEAYFELGNLLVRQSNRLSDALANYRWAIETRRDYWQAHYNLGTALMDDPGRDTDAVVHLTAAVLLQPDDPGARTNLALALADQPGRLDDAIRHLEAAVHAAPELPQPQALLRRLRSASADVIGPPTS